VADRNATVLIVDSERFLREAAAGVLARAGFATLTCSELDSAMGMACDPAVGVVLLHLSAAPALSQPSELGPGIAPDAACDLIRELVRRRPSLRVLAVAGDPELGLDALRAGAVAQLAKPLHDEELVLGVERALESHAALSECERLRDLQAATPPAGASADPSSPSSGEGGYAFAELDAELVREVCEAVVTEVEPERVVRAALAPLARGLAAAPVSLYLIDPDTGALQMEAECDGGLLSDRSNLSQTSGLTGTAIQTGQPIATPSPEADPRFDPAVDTAMDGEPRPFLCVPLKLRGKTVGLFRAFPEDGARAAARTAEMIGAVLSAAVRSVLLYRSLLATIDDIAVARREASVLPPVG
jgi:FixJ family two-component response regulator